VITGQLSDRARSIDIRDAAEEWANSKGFDSPLLREIAPLLEAKGCTSKQQQQAGKRSTWWRGVHFDGEKL
jgi:hypothetical protein